MPDSIPNPLRILGLARFLAGAWFVATGVATLRQYHDLLPLAERLFSGDSGSTGAPTRALLMLVAAIVLLVTGLVLAARGMAWMRRVPELQDRPSPLEQEEVIAALSHHQLQAYGIDPVPPYWLLRRLLDNELADMTWWRRQIMSEAVRGFVRACSLVIVVVAISLTLPRTVAGDLLGPVPTTFAIVLPFATGIWAALGLLLIESGGPRIEHVDFPVPADVADRAPGFTESPPARSVKEPSWLGLTLGLTGVAVQCLLLTWWELSPIDYPLRATSIIRFAGAIAGGTLFFVIGDRMVASAAKLLQLFRYESILTLVDREEDGAIARGAEIRTESIGLTGRRHIVSAVGGVAVLDAVRALLQSPDRPGVSR